jgi:hypothetical protein
MNIFNQQYFVATGMGSMISNENDEEKVMDYIKENLSIEQIIEFAYEKEAMSLYTRIREYFAEKGIKEY